MSRIATVEVVETPSPEVVAAWRELAERRANVFVTPEWHGAWLATHPDESPVVLVGRDAADAVKAVLPLALSRRRGIGVLRFAGSLVGDWFGPACAEEDELDFARACGPALASLGRRWQLVRLDRLERGSGFVEALAGSLPAGRALRDDRPAVLPFIELGPEGYEGWLASRGSRTRAELRRHPRRLEQRHRASWRLTASAGEVPADMHDFFRLHLARWDEKGGSQALPEHVRRFHLELARRTLERGWLRLLLLDLDGRRAAALYGWLVGGRWFSYLGGFDPEYRDARLGTVMVLRSVQEACDEGAAIYDLLRGDEGWKQRLETGRRHAESWTVVRRGRPAHLAVASYAWARRRLRALPPRAREPLRRAAGRLRGRR
ncbi:MAG: GNAT family N-acetyltransferase [Thermoleophilaceae bacterium]|nr:GNAT family N-acetyltransferase [Thermoleophilaceae bacterium]